MSGKQSKSRPVSKAPNPTVAVMVKEAIEEANEKKGSSIQAIKKYIMTTYGANITQLGPFIKRFLKNAVDSGELVQVTGKGASGSFKLGKGIANPKKRVTQAVAGVAVKPPKVVPSQATYRVTRAAKKAETSAAGQSRASQKQHQPQIVSKKKAKAEAKAAVEKKAPPKVIKSAGEKASRGGKKAAPKKQ